MQVSFDLWSVWECGLLTVNDAAPPTNCVAPPTTNIRRQQVSGMKHAFCDIQGGLVVLSSVTVYDIGFAISRSLVRHPVEMPLSRLGLFGT